MEIILISLCLIPILISAIVYPYRRNKEEENTLFNIDNVIEKLPESYFKNNIIYVRKAESSGDSKELNSHINKYYNK